tara:strand:+ start:23166 stop:23765 length:600 start_codon:yes stop_codon:yes gene_type:complete
MTKKEKIQNLLDGEVSVPDIAKQIPCKESYVKQIKTKYEKENAMAKDDPIDTDIDESVVDNLEVVEEEEKGLLESISDVVEDVVEEVVEVVEEVIEEVVEIVEDIVEEIVEDVVEDIKEYTESELDDIRMIELAKRLKKRGLGKKGRQILGLVTVIQGYRENPESHSVLNSAMRMWSKARRSLQPIPEVEDYVAKHLKR